MKNKEKKQTEESSGRSYEEAFSRLEQLVEEMESDRIGVDELVPRLKEAAELVGICKAKLHASETEVKKILEELSGSEKETESANGD